MSGDAPRRDDASQSASGHTAVCTIDSGNSMPLTSLAPRWQATWRELGAAPPPGMMDDLLARYAEPQRHYHSVQHLEECLRGLDAVRQHARKPAEIELGLWFHDAVYDVHAHDNEAASAALARAAIDDAVLAERIAALVMATRHDASLTDDDADALLLVDVDLAILGAPATRFAEYERQVRAEYAFVPEALFALKRAQVMREFALRDPLYRTPAMRERLEAQARANLARYLADG